jgi:CheY-like chemotaxis protein
MRVWVADDFEDLVGDILAFQRAEIEKDPGSVHADVKILGVSNLEDLRERIDECLRSSQPLPDVVFLDLSFESRNDGIEALRFLKFHDDGDIRTIPVIMYSQSDNSTDVYVTMVHRANAYMTKEGGLKRFWDTVAHWRSTELPGRRPDDPDLDSLMERFRAG